MKLALAAAVAILGCLLSAGPYGDAAGRPEDSAGSSQEGAERAAVITDNHGVVTRVEGLHYCHEEEVDGEIYISKYDDLFAYRGQAVIRVRLDSLARIVFTGEVGEQDGRRLLEARVTVKGRTENEADILCHPGGFLKGNVALGELEIPLESVREMVFDAGAGRGETAIRCVLPSREPAEPEAGAARLTVDGSGVLSRRTAAGVEAVPAGADFSATVYLKVAPDAAGLRDALARLARGGAREVILLP